MVSGTDEHGTPIQVQADAEGLTARELADRYNRVIAEDLTGLGMTYDLFTRTTTRNHYAVTQEIFLGLYQNGYIFPQTTLGAISPSTGRTLPDRYIEGTCPICGYPSARGDQCDNCGNQLDPVDLINPRSQDQRRDPVFAETEHFFLDLPAFAEVLGTWLQAKRPAGGRTCCKFSLNLLDDLQPRAITRDLDWGVPVPLDGWRDRPDKRIYVWFDAVIGYLSASIEWARRTGDPDAWRAWWNDPDAESYYFMGKDNIVFHSEIWPAMLLGYSGWGRGGTPGPLGALNLPTEVVSSEYLTIEGASSLVPRGGHLRPGLPGPLRRGRAALLRGRRRAGEPGHRLHLERVRPPEQRRAGRHLGQPGQPRGLVRGPQHRLDPRGGDADRPRTRSCWPGPGRRSARSASTWAGPGSSSPSPRRCGRWPRPTSTSPSRRRGSCAKPTRSGCAPSCTWPCSSSTTPRRCSPRSCPARPSWCTRCWAARAPGRTCRARGGRRGRAARLTR